ncbi:MAG: nitrilase-related carbon-nitrogen hydrolase, partial [Pseudomonadota bacterium]
AANRAVVFGPDGDRIAVYDKIHMFDVDLDNGESWRESAVYEPGRSGVMVDVLGARFGLGICYDCRFPALHNAYAKAGVSVLTSPSCFTRQTGRAHWHVLMRSRAIENGAFMISAAQGGDMEDGRETYGHSIIVNPWGEVLAEVDGEEPGMAVADINLADVAAARAKVPNLVNQRAFDLQMANLDGTGNQMAAAS